MTDHTSHTTHGTDDPQLRDLLTAAVPDDAPTLDAARLARDARTARTRRRTATAVGGVLAVGATVAGVGLLGGQDPAARDDTTATTAPYDAPTCPATLPELPDAVWAVDSLDGLASVRICPDLDATAGPLLSVDEKGQVLASMDALVQSDRFGEQVDVAETFDPERCATISVVNSRQSLQLTFDDGRSVLLPTAMCSPISVAGREIDGGALGTAYLAALDGQRDDLTYSHPFSGPLPCAGRGSVPDAARPGREQLVAAVLCTPDGEEVAPLSDAQLADLNDAWRSAKEFVQDPTADDESECTAPEDAPSYLVVGTDHSDVMRFSDTGCGFLVWSGWRPGDSQALPTTLADLGLTP
ncbi:hypothetical protein ACFQ0K_11255 [Nocardioides caeni]|uniref:Uncharacterized protein n=1 Tax=Nocardioides caeni TaxID=574700 RepID=A0A4S8NLU9_9ACTN|nr:hypothetical protein [Nocardioides caeni]THV17963.1 hypothetical protein E9934_05815 [Nocardioides caeni]